MASCLRRLGLAAMVPAWEEPLLGPVHAWLAGVAERAMIGEGPPAVCDQASAAVGQQAIGERTDVGIARL
eukprot:7270691-Pyramimonas_sp.AAC.1